MLARYLITIEAISCIANIRVSACSHTYDDVSLNIAEYNRNEIEKFQKNWFRNRSRLALSIRGRVHASRRFRKVTKLVSVPWERQDPDIVSIAEEEAPADSSHGRVHWHHLSFGHSPSRSRAHTVDRALLVRNKRSFLRSSVRSSQVRSVSHHTSSSSMTVSRDPLGFAETSRDMPRSVILFVFVRERINAIPTRILGELR